MEEVCADGNNGNESPTEESNTPSYEGIICMFILVYSNPSKVKTFPTII